MSFNWEGLCKVGDRKSRNLVVEELRVHRTIINKKPHEYTYRGIQDLHTYMTHTLSKSNTVNSSKTVNTLLYCWIFEYAMYVVPGKSCLQDFEEMFPGYW